MNLRSAFISLIAGLAFCTSGLAVAQNFTGSDIAAIWESPTPAYDGTNKLYGKYVFELTNSQWSFVFTASADAAGSQKLFGLRFGRSPYKLGSPVAGLANAIEGDFDRGSFFLTAFAQPMAELFEKSNCGNGKWVAGVEQEVTANGCAFIPSKTQCPKELDIVVFDGKTLSFGDRSGNLCALPRPSKASKVVLVRRPTSEY